MRSLCLIKVIDQKPEKLGFFLQIMGHYARTAEVLISNIELYDPCFCV